MYLFMIRMGNKIKNGGVWRTIYKVLYVQEKHLELSFLNLTLYLALIYWKK